MKYVIIKGVETPIHFGLKAICDFSEEREIDFDKLMNADNVLSNLNTMVPLAVMAFNEGARRSGDHTKRVTEFEVWDMFEDDPKLILEVAQIFMGSTMPMMDKLGGIAKNSNRPAE